MNGVTDLTDGFYIEDWRVEPSLGLVSKNNESMQIEPKIMQVLVRLAESEGTVVRKEEFIADIWEGLNVTQHVLTRTISEIRRIFGDDAQNPRYVQTIPKVGYRLIANISVPALPSTRNANTAFKEVLRAEGVAMLSNPVFAYFLGGILTVILGIATLLAFLLLLHRNGNPHN